MNCNPARKIGDLQNINLSFTRAGNFYLDSDGAIVNGDGKYLIGKPDSSKWKS